MDFQNITCLKMINASNNYVANFTSTKKSLAQNTIKNPTS